MSMTGPGRESESSSPLSSVSAAEDKPDVCAPAELKCDPHALHTLLTLPQAASPFSCSALTAWPL